MQSSASILPSPAHTSAKLNVKLSAGLYVHIPFCRQACHYCDFHFSTNATSANAMLDAIGQEASLQAGNFPFAFHTLYMGGGTPSFLGTPQLQGLLSRLRTELDLSAVQECTLEANPEDVTPQSVAAWRAMGINRISLGVQTFDHARLAAANRNHNAEASHRALQLLLQGGIPNISADLMFSFPGQTLAELEADIDTMLLYPIPHISCYSLTIEPGTVFGRRAAKGQLKTNANDLEADMLALVWSKLENAGFESYEVSNHARPGYRSVHNSAYWHGAPYLGLGPSAHSYLAPQRMANVRSNARYMAEIAKGLLPQEIEILSPTDMANEAIITQLRLLEGIDLYANARQHGLVLAPAQHNTIAQALTSGSAQMVGTHLVLGPTGRLRADAIASDLMW